MRKGLWPKLFQLTLATVANWGCNMVVAATFLTLTEKLGKGGAFWFYGAVCLIGIVFCYFYVPETKGITLEKIETYLHSGKRLGRMGAEEGRI